MRGWHCVSNASPAGTTNLSTHQSHLAHSILRGSFPEAQEAFLVTIFHDNRHWPWATGVGAGRRTGMVRRWVLMIRGKGFSKMSKWRMVCWHIRIAAASCLFDLALELFETSERSMHSAREGSQPCFSVVGSLRKVRRQSWRKPSSIRLSLFFSGLLLSPDQGYWSGIAQRPEHI